MGSDGAVEFFDRLFPIARARRLYSLLVTIHRWFRYPGKEDGIANGFRPQLDVNLGGIAGVAHSNISGVSIYDYGLPDRLIVGTGINCQRIIRSPQRIKSECAVTIRGGAPRSGDISV